MNNFLNIKIGFSLIVILLSMLGIFAIDRIDKISNQTQEIYKHPFKVTKSAITIDKYLISMHRYMKDVVLSQNDKQLKEAIEYVNRFSDNLIQTVMNLNIKHIDNEEFGCVTISMGVGIISNNSNLSSNEIYDKVDALMYKAKKNGRNNMIIKEIE